MKGWRKISNTNSNKRKLVWLYKYQAKQISEQKYYRDKESHLIITGGISSSQHIPKVHNTRPVDIYIHTE